MSNKITIVKQDHLGVEVIRYQGQVLMRTAAEIMIEAFFALEHAMMVDIPLLKGDKFLETYFTGHWYNIYEIHDRDSDHLKGWYCNVSYPAEISQSLVVFRDLALDLVVLPDGCQVVLDEDEFQKLVLSPDDRNNALAGLAALQDRFKEKFGI